MTTDAGPEVQAAVSAAFRADWGQVVATLIAVTGDWDLAEECAQDAFARALQTWQRDGVPARPGAWLTTTARNRAVDVLLIVCLPRRWIRTRTRRFRATVN